MSDRLEPPDQLAAEAQRLLDESKFPLVSVHREFLLSVIATLKNCPQDPKCGMPEMMEETRRLRALGECPNCGELPHAGPCSP